MVVAPMGQAVRVPDLHPVLADLADEQAALDDVVAALDPDQWEDRKSVV